MLSSFTWTWVASDDKLWFSKYLSTQGEVCTGKYIPGVYVQSERGLYEKNRRQMVSTTDRKNEISKEFIIWLTVGYLSQF